MTSGSYVPLIRLLRPLIAALLGCVLLCGCDTSHSERAADKAGGSEAPRVLLLGASDTVDQPESRAVRYFAGQVAKLSHGALRVELRFEAAGDRSPDVEARTEQMVRDGKFDLGWIGARAWDARGVKSFQALQAPFLVTNYALLDRVLTSPLANEMLAGLKRQHVVGIALLPGLLRHPVGLRGPLVSLADFRRARVRIQPSRATSELMMALGAKPVAVSNSSLVAAIAHRRIDGEELSLGNAPGGSTLTANVTFFAKALTLFASRRAYERLSYGERNILREAAKQTLGHLVAGHPSESALARAFCRDDGRIVLAGERESAALVRADRPVYAQLERDPQTKALIVRIRRLKQQTPADPVVVPAACSRRAQSAPPPHGPPRAPSIVNGTYHVLFKRADALAFGPPANAPQNLARAPGVETRILADGKWRFGGLRGTYMIRGKTITFVTPAYGSAESFTFTFDRGGFLRLRPVLPMDRGDQWVVAGEPWRRVGAPRTIR